MLHVSKTGHSYRGHRVPFAEAGQPAEKHSRCPRPGTSAYGRQRYTAALLLSIWSREDKASGVTIPRKRIVRNFTSRLRKTSAHACRVADLDWWSARVDFLAFLNPLRGQPVSALTARLASLCHRGWARRPSSAGLPLLPFAGASSPDLWAAIARVGAAEGGCWCPLQLLVAVGCVFCAVGGAVSACGQQACQVRD
jgi:hypothetical protein